MIKETYESIRNSALWETSVLIIPWDEHGGFYDHVSPPSAVAPGDPQPGANITSMPSRSNSMVFAYRRSIDHRLYDHASIPAMMRAVFGAGPLSARDRQANSPSQLLWLKAARQDAPLAQSVNITLLSGMDAVLGLLPGTNDGGDASGFIATTGGFSGLAIPAGWTNFPSRAAVLVADTENALSSLGCFGEILNAGRTMRF